jgi:hypothetical protein
MPHEPPEPAELQRRFEESRALDWGPELLPMERIAELYGAEAARRSLGLLENAVDAEPVITQQFLEALPEEAAAYGLEHRVKSPESLARKVRDRTDAERRFLIDDLLRYTAITETPDELVNVARRTVEDLQQVGWQPKYAMHSYTENSRYKGIHVYLATPGAPRTEVQFHSRASMLIKEATTSWYQIERSATASVDERAAARRKCVELSATLQQPAGIQQLTALGGKRVHVNNYSDSRGAGHAATQGQADSAGSERSTRARDRNDGVAR